MGEDSKKNEVDVASVIQEVTQDPSFEAISRAERILVVDNPATIDETVGGLRHFAERNGPGAPVIYRATTAPQALEILSSHSPTTVVLAQSKLRTGLPDKIRQHNGEIEVVEKPDLVGLALASSVAFEYDQDLRNYSTMKIGGTAKCVASPDSKEGLQALLQLCSRYGISYRRRGRGSNSIYGNVDGILISMPKLRDVLSVSCRGTNYTDEKEFEEVIKGLEIGEEVYVEAGAGAFLPALAKLAVRYSLRGAEFVRGIPGTPAGAVTMNAGVAAKETKEIFEYADTFDPAGRSVRLTRDDLQFGHRASTLQDAYDSHVVYSVVFRLTKGDQQQIAELTDRYKNERRPEPKEPSIGSMWRRRNNVKESEKDNPEAARLQTDDLVYWAQCAGWCSENRSIYIPKEREYISFFLVDGGNMLSRPPHPTAYDVVELAKRIYDKVLETQDVKLVLEGRFIGVTKAGRTIYPVVKGVLDGTYTLEEVRDELHIGGD